MAAFPNGIIYFGSLCRQLVSYFDGETNDKGLLLWDIQNKDIKV